MNPKTPYGGDTDIQHLAALQGALHQPMGDLLAVLLLVQRALPQVRLW